ncbi:hypothetical protein MNBD_NITROSPINAE01-610 [hydrothermal vent metagenome]|uniref:Type cbb3 cytochrome oxidase biogenesis protein CcoH n=1 Tax=hydrothermal vent metagenome TaxID=652676 RepID=A0A3B1CYY1_9ZZZZ
MTIDKHKHEPAWKSPWIRGMVGLISVVLVANGIMVYVAITTSPGLVTTDYYERGKNFVNRTKIEYVQRVRLGWQMNLSLPKEAQANTPAKFQMSITGKNGAPAVVDSSTLFAYRPSDSTLDFAVPMEHSGSGNFTADVLFPAKGAWDIIVEVKKGDGHHSVAKRINVAD